MERRTQTLFLEEIPKNVDTKYRFIFLYNPYHHICLPTYSSSTIIKMLPRELMKIYFTYICNITASEN